MSKLICTTTVLAAMLGVLYLLLAVEVVVPGWWGFPISMGHSAPIPLIAAMLGAVVTVALCGGGAVVLIAAAVGLTVAAHSICTWLRTIAGVEKP